MFALPLSAAGRSLTVGIHLLLHMNTHTQCCFEYLCLLEHFLTFTCTKSFSSCISIHLWLHACTLSNVVVLLLRMVGEVGWRCNGCVVSSFQRSGTRAAYVTCDGTVSQSQLMQKGQWRGGGRRGKETAQAGASKNEWNGTVAGDRYYILGCSQIAEKGRITS